MKMFKKIMAVVLTGALAVSMLTGCSLSEMAKAKALEKALNTANAQDGTQVVKYNHENGLDAKAEKVYEEVFSSKKETLAESSTLNKFTPKNSTTNYAYYVVKAPVKAADLKKSGEWSATDLHKAIFGSVKLNGKNGNNKAVAINGQFVKNAANDKATKAEVDFGVKIYNNGKEGNAKAYYAIVVVKLAA